MPRFVSIWPEAIQISKSSRPWLGRGMDEARAGVVGDVVAVEQRDGERVAASPRRG